MLSLLNPLQGSKIIIEGRNQKSGKTLLGVSMCVNYTAFDPEIIIYGNIPVEHSNYILKTKLTQKDFKKGKRYIVFIDEADLDYTWQDAHYNEGMWAFWGRGSSHNRCAVVITIQNEYGSMKRGLQRTSHILVNRTIFNGETNLPFVVIGELLYSNVGLRGEFIQNIENAVNRYDPYNIGETKIDFNSWRSRRIRENGQNSSTPSSKLHKAQKLAVEKLMNDAISRYGTITEAARATKVSKGFFYDIMRAED